MGDHLVYLATGDEEFLVQAQHAILSALAWEDRHPFDVVVYTDRPDAFAFDRRVRTVDLPPAQARAWRGRWDFFYRMKAVVIREAVRAFPAERVLFVDADTYFTGPVGDAFERMRGERAVMHTREYHVATTGTGQMRRFRRRMLRSKFRGERVGVDFWMWNSGVVGVHARHGEILDDWIAFLDDVFPTNPVPIIEQYGLSMLLQRGGVEIASVDDVICHYYADKDRHAAAIRDRIAAARALPLAEAGRVLRAPITFTGPAPRPPRRPRLQRAWESLRLKLRLRAARLREGV
jgi:hypothetical protein